MKARDKYRFYPTDQQRQSFAPLCSCIQAICNDALAVCQQSQKWPAPQIVNNNPVIVLEDLNIGGMIKNRKLSRAITDLEWQQLSFSGEDVNVRPLW